jgi:hypothetical protein
MRLLTRSDFDGLVCAVFLTEVGIIDNYKFVHPKDIQNQTVEVTSDDVLANIPYHPNCGIWFDHHVIFHIGSLRRYQHIYAIIEILVSDRSV